MARVEEHHGKSAASVSARPNRHRNKKRDRPSKKADHNKRAEPPQRKTSYKVVYEEIDVDNKEKKLRTLVSRNDRVSSFLIFCNL